MKTLLEIGSTTLLLPENTKPSQVLELLVGAKVLRNQTHYGPDGSYSGKHYFSREVIQHDQDRISISCVPDKDVVSEAQWQEMCADADQKAAAESKAKDLPAAVK